jgi:thiol-disulfide isomerase/thioredoxin
MTWLLAVVAIAAVVVFTGNGDDANDAVDIPIDTETGPIDVYGDFLTPYSDPDTGAGLAIPTVRATLLDGRSTELGPDGTARLIGFFAHWCPHCQAEVPVVRRWLETTTFPDGFEMVAVSTAVDPSAPNYPPSEWFAREDWQAPVILDDSAGSMAAAYGLTRFPYWVVVDADGTVVSRTTGELTEAQLDGLVELAAGTPADVAP